MPGTLGADYILTSAGIINLLDLRRLSPKSYVNFNGTGVVAIRDSENVSSITDNGTGDYFVNFITPQENDGYAVGFSLAGSGAFAPKILDEVTPRTVGRFRLYFSNNNGSVAVDPTYGNAIVSGGT